MDISEAWAAGNGAIYSWGDNTNGGLGDGTNTDRSTPVAVANVGEVAAFTAGLSPAVGTYTSARTVALATSTPGAAIRYTLDGADPTGSSPVYTTALTIGTTTTLKAVGFKTNWSDSDVRSAPYTMNFGTLTAPPMTPGPGT
jgi:chitinase